VNDIKKRCGKRKYLTSACDKRIDELLSVE
jgi:hypothetical protein